MRDGSEERGERGEKMGEGRKGRQAGREESGG